MSDKCPRGFVVSESTGKCIPEGKSISDRLMLKYERYFFKEDKDMDLLNEFSGAGPEINQLYHRYENDIEQADRACGRQYGGFKAFKKENKVKYHQCRKAGHIQAAKAYISALKSYAGKCRTGPFDTESCMNRLRKDLEDAQKKLQAAMSMRESESFTILDEIQEMDKCKPGYRWCSKTNKCVEDTDDKLQGKRLGRGQGEGPMGKPFKEAEDMVDIAFDEGFEVFTKLKVAKSKVDDVLDNLQLECGCQQGAGMGREKGYMRSQMGGFPGEEDDEYEDAYDAMDHVGPNDIDAVPDEKVSNLYRSVRKQMGEWRHVTKESRNERYKKFFRSMLDTYGVESPDDIEDEETKKEFFNKVNRGWQTKNESVDNFLDEISKGEVLGLGASLVAGSALTYFWYRQDVKGCYKRFANDKEQLKRCLTHYKYCSHLAQNKDKYEKCLKEKGTK